MGDQSSNRALYFERVPKKDWKLRDAYKEYKHKLPRGVNIYEAIKRDLLTVKNTRKALTSSADSILEDLDFLEEQVATHSSQPDAAPQIILAGENNENYNACTVFQTAAIGDKRSSASHINTDEPTSPTQLKRAKKSYSFVSSIVPLATGKDSPRITKEDASEIADRFIVALSSTGGTIPELVAQEYNDNITEQQQLVSLKKHRSVDQYLSRCLDCKWEDFGRFLDDASTVKGEDEKAVAMIRRIMYDYHANCLKPMFTTRFNERTPFAEHVLPVLKYFGASTGLVSFLWCEIGSKAQKQLKICLSNGQKKLLDGIGFDEHKLERVLVEYSGEEDGDHTEEDTLKLMECSRHCLKAEMDNLLFASWDTFTRRQVLSIQCVSDKITLLSTKRLSTGKWCLIEVRSAVIPRDWQRRNSWVRVFDLLFKLQELLLEQEEVTVLLDREHSGRDVVDPANTIHANLKRIQNLDAQ